MAEMTENDRKRLKLWMKMTENDQKRLKLWMK